jgi:hypothetical protein
MSNVSGQLDLYIEQSLRKVKDHEAIILNKRNQLSLLKTEEFLPTIRMGAFDDKPISIPHNKAYLLREISKKVLVFGKAEVPEDFFEVDCNKENGYLINFLVATSKTNTVKYQAVFNPCLELTEIKNLDKNLLLDTKELWILIGNVGDIMLEYPDDLVYKKNFIDMLKGFYMNNLTRNNDMVGRPLDGDPRKRFL